MSYTLAEKLDIELRQEDFESFPGDVEAAKASLEVASSASVTDTYPDESHGRSDCPWGLTD